MPTFITSPRVKQLRLTVSCKTQGRDFVVSFSESQILGLHLKPGESFSGHTGKPHIPYTGKISGLVITNPNKRHGLHRISAVLREGQRINGVSAIKFGDVVCAKQPISVSVEDRRVETGRVEIRKQV